VTGSTLVRHLYLGDRLIADSPVTAAAGMAALPESERSILLARAMSEAMAARPTLYPVIAFSSMGAVALSGGVLLLGTVLAFAPGRVRLAYLGKVRRGRVAMLVVLFMVALSPLPLARPAWGGGGGGGGGSPPPPTYPVYFIHSDHLGSTVMLSCYMMDNVSGCRGGTVIRYYRYDAYGQPRAYDASGQAVMLGTALLGNWGGYYIPERLYTGQRWDWQAQVYDYGARFYDPKTANFLTQDPVRQGVNPYAYVAWNPVRFTDPTGMFFGTGGDLSLATFAESIMGNPQALGFEQLCALRGISANVGAPLGGAMGAPLGGAGVAGGLAALASAVAGIAATIQSAVSMGGDSRLVSAIGEAILGMGGYLAAMLRGDVLDLGGGIYGTVSGIIKGVGEIGLGIAKLDSTMFKQGAGNLGAALVMPRLNNHGGLNWPGTVDNSPASPFPSSGTKVENASIAHDIDVKRSGFLHSAAAEFRWIANSWSGSGTEPGPYGQAYRLLGTVGFGVAGSVLLPLQ
jgi:RHS repeat-associated protein